LGAGVDPGADAGADVGSGADTDVDAGVVFGEDSGTGSPPPPHAARVKVNNKADGYAERFNTCYSL
jgi:hypothetical protein